MIARWPGKIQEGAVSDHISYFPDMLPTFTDLAGTRPTRPTDGISILPTLLEKGTQEQHDFLFFSNALRMDDWKLVRGKENDELFNLARDVGESTDVSGRYPEVLDRLIKLWEANQIRE